MPVWNRIPRSINHAFLVVVTTILARIGGLFAVQFDFVHGQLVHDPGLDCLSIFSVAGLWRIADCVAGVDPSLSGVSLAGAIALCDHCGHHSSFGDRHQPQQLLWL